MFERINVFGQNLDNHGTIIQDFFDMINPIGKIYVQFPQQSDPNDIYNNDVVQSVWEEQLQYNNAFFRSENAPTKIYKADNDTQYYLYNGMNIMPINVEGLSSPVVDRSDSIVVDGKTYYAYTSGSGWKTNISNDFNGNLQGNQDKQHTHENTLYTVTQPNFVLQFQTAASFEMLFLRGDNEDKGFGVARLIANSGDIVDLGETRGAVADIQTNNDKDLWRRRYYAHHTHSCEISDMGISINNAYYGNPGDEARPDNYTVKIWKRIS